MDPSEAAVSHFGQTLGTLELRDIWAETADVLMRNVRRFSHIFQNEVFCISFKMTFFAYIFQNDVFCIISFKMKFFAYLSK